MYESPIELLFTDIHHQIVEQQDEQIYQAVMHFVPNVNREELLRALKYDRHQYEKGYADGKADAMAKLVRCKDCNKGRPIDKTKCPEKYFKESCVVCLCEQVVGDEPMIYEPTHFCSYGERRTNETNNL